MKTTITIEMNDDEYSAYKDFLNGKYVKVGSPVRDFLEKSGFEEDLEDKRVMSSIVYDPLAGPVRIRSIAVFKKGNAKVTIEGEE